MKVLRDIDSTFVGIARHYPGKPEQPFKAIVSVQTLDSGEKTSLFFVIVCNWT